MENFVAGFLQGQKPVDEVTLPVFKVATKTPQSAVPVPALALEDRKDVEMPEAAVPVTESQTLEGPSTGKGAGAEEVCEEG